MIIQLLAISVIFVVCWLPLMVSTRCGTENCRTLCWR